MSGFLKFLDVGIIEHLPKIVGVQSTHANPVFKYYLEPDREKRRFVPVKVRPSVAQAAMIGNPVSMPRVIELVAAYNRKAGRKAVFVVEVEEQAIMDWELVANRNGHIACTQGGESLAGLVRAKEQDIISADEFVVLDATAHALKFSGFQEMYFEDRFPEGYEILPRESLKNAPELIEAAGVDRFPTPENSLEGEAFDEFVGETAKSIAEKLNLKAR
jgi:threonine synthase